MIAIQNILIEPFNFYYIVSLNSDASKDKINISENLMNAHQFVKNCKSALNNNFFKTINFFLIRKNM